MDDVLIIPGSPTFFPQAYECENGKRSEDEISVYANKFDEWYISDGGESCEQDVIKFSPSNVELTDSIP